MKWRNAYILIYERKNPIEINSEDEEEKSYSKNNEEVDFDMQTSSNQISILPEIEEKIAYENQKYWQNRFLFSTEYAELVQDVSVNWNTSVIIPKKFLNKNDDFHIYNEPIPPEYINDQTILDPVDEKIDLTKINSHEEIEKMELDVFKFAS